MLYPRSAPFDGLASSTTRSNVVWPHFLLFKAIPSSIPLELAKKRLEMVAGEDQRLGMLAEGGSFR